jgi:uncharacterized protein (TIGR03083 family)
LQRHCNASPKPSDGGRLSVGCPNRTEAQHNRRRASQDGAVLTPRPITVSDHVQAYGQARIRLAALANGLTDGQAATVVPSCPDWTVTQVYAHIAGVASALVHRRNPGPDLQAWIDGHITDRAGQSASALADEWNEVAVAFEGLIEAKPAAFAGLLYDVIAHEHDIAHALGVVGERTGLGVECALALALPLLERDLASHGLGPVAIDVNGDRWQAGDGEPALVLHAPTQFEALRLLGSRRSADQMRAATWTGPGAAELDRYIPALDHLGLPVGDIIE